MSERKKAPQNHLHLFSTIALTADLILTCKSSLHPADFLQLQLRNPGVKSLIPSTETRQEKRM